MMKKIDKGVVLVIAVLLGCVIVRAALDAAASLILPVLLVGAIYTGFRAWQGGYLAKFMPEKRDPAKKENT